MRDETERQEAIKAGTVTLVGTDPARIVTAVRHGLTTSHQAINPYGDGQAAMRIVNIMAGLK